MEEKVKKPKKHKFTVGIRIDDIWVDKEIMAESFEDAHAIAESMKLKDVINVNGDWVDGGNKHVLSIYDQNEIEQIG